MTDPRLLESLMKEVTEEIRKLWDTLMGLEMELVDQLEVLSSGVKSLLNKTQRMTNTEYSSRFLPKYMYTKERFSSLLGHCFPLFFHYYLQCIFKLNNYYELFHQVSYRRFA